MSVPRPPVSVAAARRRGIAAAIGLALAGLPFAAPATADGCYVCTGSRIYVRFRGDDAWAKRKKAEACGCRVEGVASRCDAAGVKVLCSVEIRAAR